MCDVHVVNVIDVSELQASEGGPSRTPKTRPTYTSNRKMPDRAPLARLWP